LNVVNFLHDTFIVEVVFAKLKLHFFITLPFVCIIEMEHESFHISFIFMTFKLHLNCNCRFHVVPVIFSLPKIIDDSN